MIDLKLAIYESEMNGLITESQRDEMLIILEAEEDHEIHNIKKNLVAANKNVDPDSLKNKKYKNEKSAKRADIKYAYADSIKDESNNHSYGYRGRTYDEEGRPTRDNPLATENYYEIQKDSDYKHLMLMKKNLNTDNPKQIEQYKKLYKSLCAKYNIPEISTLHVKFEKNREDGGEISHYTDYKQLKGEGQKFSLPNGYGLYHVSDKDGLKELKPNVYSDRYLHDGMDKNKSNGIYYPEPRCYFHAAKSPDDIKVSNGNHLYKLSHTPSNIWLDGEQTTNHGKQGVKAVLKSRMKTTAVYVNSVKPLKVTQIK